MGGIGIPGSDLIYGKEVILFMAGFQQDHKGRVQFIQLQDIAARIVDDKIVRSVSAYLLQEFLHRRGFCIHKRLPGWFRLQQGWDVLDPVIEAIGLSFYTEIIHQENRGTGNKEPMFSAI